MIIKRMPSFVLGVARLFGGVVHTVGLRTQPWDDSAVNVEPRCPKKATRQKGKSREHLLSLSTLH
jgi:hypothetical protein